ncbi:MAG TPA: hypothetical protein VL485_12450 [Ktedonobacteraceae bacterium]|jgi:hypothetical protein|nr:hypothetical protein [Ktedonobacteraceae bacterium]
MVPEMPDTPQKSNRVPPIPKTPLLGSHHETSFLVSSILRSTSPSPAPATLSLFEQKLLSVHLLIALLSLCAQVLLVLVIWRQCKKIRHLRA